MVRIIDRVELISYSSAEDGTPIPVNRPEYPVDTAT